MLLMMTHNTQLKTHLLLCHACLQGLDVCLPLLEPLFELRHGDLGNGFDLHLLSKVAVVSVC